MNEFIGRVFTDKLILNEYHRILVENQFGIRICIDTGNLTETSAHAFKEQTFLCDLGLELDRKKCSHPVET